MARGSSAEPGGRILTTHPQGKKRVNISRRKYDVMSAAILRSLREEGESPYKWYARRWRETFKASSRAPYRGTSPPGSSTSKHGGFLTVCQGRDPGTSG